MDICLCEKLHHRAFHFIRTSDVNWLYVCKLSCNVHLICWKSFFLSFFTCPNARSLELSSQWVKPSQRFNTLLLCSTPKLCHVWIHWHSLSALVSIHVNTWCCQFKVHHDIVRIIYSMSKIVWHIKSLSLYTRKVFCKYMRGGHIANLGLEIWSANHWLT